MFIITNIFFISGTHCNNVIDVVRGVVRYNTQWMRENLMPEATLAALEASLSSLPDPSAKLVTAPESSNCLALTGRGQGGGGEEGEAGDVGTFLCWGKLVVSCILQVSFGV